MGDFLGHICLGRPIGNGKRFDLSLVVCIEDKVSSHSLIILAASCSPGLCGWYWRMLVLSRRWLIDGRGRVMEGDSASLVHTNICLPFHLAIAMRDATRALRACGLTYWRRAW